MGKRELLAALFEDARAGRWWWESDALKECGLHVQEESDGSGI